MITPQTIGTIIHSSTSLGLFLIKTENDYVLEERDTRTDETLRIHSFNRVSGTTLKGSEEMKVLKWILMLSASKETPQERKKYALFASDYCLSFIEQ